MRGGLSRSIEATYRFGLRLSYTGAILGAFAGCSYRPASIPPTAVIADAVPASWKAPGGGADGMPTIVGARFSSLDVELGEDWDGDIVTSTDVAHVVLHTNLFDIEANRTTPGHFHFLQHIIDDPAFIVRPYAVDVIATTAAGKLAKLTVPFRLRGHGVR